MMKLETQITHTAKLTWDYHDRLDKRDLINGLTNALPNGAQITGLSVADVPQVLPGTAKQVVRRTLTISYVDDPLFARYRRP